MTNCLPVLTCGTLRQVTRQDVAGLKNKRVRSEVHDHHILEYHALHVTVEGCLYMLNVTSELVQLWMLPETTSKATRCQAQGNERIQFEGKTQH